MNLGFISDVLKIPLVVIKPVNQFFACLNIGFSCDFCGVINEMKL